MSIMTPEERDRALVRAGLRIGGLQGLPADDSDEACDKIIASVEIHSEETEDIDVMPRVNGKVFRCEECNANVFRRLLNDPSKYKCNSCGTIYLGV